MINLDYKTALKFLQDAIEERGEDFVYLPEGDACLYVHDNRDGTGSIPGCIVGLALNKAGIDLELLRRFDIDGGTTANQVLSNLETSEELTVLDASTYTLYNIVQRRQDSGHTWGESLKYAKAIVEQEK